MRKQRNFANEPINRKLDLLYELCWKMNTRISRVEAVSALVSAVVAGVMVTWLT